MMRRVKIIKNEPIMNVMNDEWDETNKRSNNNDGSENENINSEEEKERPPPKKSS